MDTEANKGTTVTVLGRVLGVDQALITRISVASCTRRIVNLGATPGAAPIVVEEGSAVDVSASVFDTPQTGNGWQFGTGWNFRDRFVVTAVGRNLIEYTFVDANSCPIVWTKVVRVVDVP